MSCAGCARRDEDLRQLRLELGQLNDAAFLSTVTRQYRLAPQAARVLMALYQVNGRPLTRWQLEERIGGACESNLIAQYVRQLRRLIGEDAVRSDYGVGYSLSPAALARIAEAYGASFKAGRVA